MAVFNYSWDDVGAPQLYCSTLGCFTNILDACLVGTSGTAYGSKASMGWTLAYTDTNQRAYRQPTGTCQFYFAINDNTANVLYLRGYEAMSDITTGTNPFPHTTALASYTQEKPLFAASSLPVPWKIYSNGKIFYFAFDGNSNFVKNTSNGTYTTWYNQPRSRTFIFGDFPSYKSGDTYNCVIYSPYPVGTTEPFAGYINNAITGLYVARDYAGTAGGKQLGRDAESFLHTDVSCPSPLFGGSMELARVSIYEVMVGVRGFLPGVWYVVGDYTGYLPVSFNLKDHYIETSCGRSMELIPAYVAQTLAYEISDTWDEWPITNYI